MALAEKITAALHQNLQAEYVLIDREEDQISGFVVSSQFENLSSRERQQLISQTLRQPDFGILPEEMQQIALLVGVTPAEYDSMGAQIKVHVEDEGYTNGYQLLIRGSFSDANYIRRALGTQPELTVSEPYQEPGLAGILLCMDVMGPAENPLTIEHLSELLTSIDNVVVVQKV